MDIRPGMLLVATTELADPNFAGSVVLLLDVTDQGSLGVTLNRSSRIRVGDVLPAWAEPVSPPEVLFQGGPVSTDGAIGVGRLRQGQPAPSSWHSVTLDVGILDLDTPPDLVQSALIELRIFAGHAGWGPGQLSAEIAEGSWYVVPGRPGDVFGVEPDRLRSQVLRRQPGRLAWQATRPVNPRLN